MTMCITPQDLDVFYQFVYQNVAKKLGVKDCEWKLAYDLADEIRNTNSVIADRLQEFINGYDSWFNEHKRIDGGGATGNLSAAENNAVINAIERRDSARQKLIDEIAKLKPYSQAS